MADYYSLIAKAVGTLDLNTEKARRRVYERARTALHSRMHGAYPPFHQSQIAAAELSLQMAIDAVEAEVAVKQNAKSATHISSSRRARGSVTPSQPANQNDEARWSLATLWASIFRRAGDDPQNPGEARSGHSRDGIDRGEPLIPGLPNSWLAPRAGAIIMSKTSHRGGHKRKPAGPTRATTTPPNGAPPRSKQSGVEDGKFFQSFVHLSYSRREVSCAKPSSLSMNCGS
jgi:hypothetical protein